MTQEIYWELLAWLFRSFLGAGLPSVTECRPAF